ncbi:MULTISPECIES: hypothetical protein [unclassified Nostoc]|uniref:hypothetical protein n=1 Tax=unclassified Nostoc TaxID=2593658 RepID=UPI002AD522E7|nr:MULTISPECIES: hypothetical protein [unclassified Nostoc]MDZ8121795.1 hypothetical protein [Nostoc sp. CmiVER01]MDZ8223577.1 hypothetical protein [Nostoc sp. ChiVER01]
MKFNTKFAIALVAATSVFSLASGAMAGEAGAAGAAAFTIDSDNKVTGVAVAAAVGRNDAAAAAFQGAEGIPNAAYALGSGGLITLESIGEPATASIKGATSTALNETNTLGGNATIQIGTTSPNSVVTLGTPAP